MKRVYKIYFETSLCNRLGDQEYHRRRKISYRFLRRCVKDHHVLTSKLVLREIQATPALEERRHILRRVWSARPRVITTSRRVERIALDLLEAGGRGDDLFADMLHIGYSIVAGADALVTWDEGTWLATTRAGSFRRTGGGRAWQCPYWGRRRKWQDGSA